MAGTSRTTFKTTPTHDELRGMHRDLRFQPTTNRHPTTISEADMASFNRCGYLKGIPILDDEAVGRHRSLFDGHLAAVLAAGQTSIYSELVGESRKVEKMRRPLT